jgi:hypothetical protein
MTATLPYDQDSLYNNPSSMPERGVAFFQKKAGSVMTLPSEEVRVIVNCYIRLIISF